MRKQGLHHTRLLYVFVCLVLLSVSAFVFAAGQQEKPAAEKVTIDGWTWDSEE